MDNPCTENTGAVVYEWCVHHTKHSKAARVSPRENVLLPVDFSAASQTAFATALDLLGTRARIILLHVIPISFGADAFRGSFEAAQKKLSDFAKDVSVTAEQRVESIVRAGIPFQEILTATKDHKINLIVLGIDESNPFGGLALGHTADRISRYAWCSVLLVRSDHSYPDRRGSISLSKTAPPSSRE